MRIGAVECGLGPWPGERCAPRQRGFERPVVGSG
jgi:hypothetical protein